MIHKVFLLLLLAFAINGQQRCQDYKIKTSETVLDSPVLKEKPPLYIAPDFTTVFAYTSGKTLYRSTNSGASFTQVKFNSTVKFRDVQLSTDKKSIILVADGENKLFSSPNGGEVWNTLNAPGRMENFKFHPSKPSWVLATKNNCPTYNCSYDLYLSQDLGDNWMLLRTYVWMYDWLGTEDVIIAWEKTEKFGTQYLPPFTNQVVKSEHFFRSTPLVIADEVVGYLSLAKRIFIAKEERSGGLSLLVSVDDGLTFHDTRFPGGTIENRYSILDTTAGSTFINVDHTALGENNWGSLYVGDGVDIDFVLSLEYNPRTHNGKCDFKRVQGLEGIYLANQYAKTSSDTTRVGSGKQTMISYDKGGHWKRLAKPVNHIGDCHADDDCKLNLFGNSNSGEWYSRTEAVGLIISSGMTGQYIVQSTADIAVYFSRDAGWTWEYITNGSYTYEIGNRGAILLMTLDILLTTDMKYSIDEGLNWTTCKMLSTAFDVDDIVSDPRMSSGVFLIYGKRDGKGVIVQADFADVHENDCVGHDTPDVAGSDYETWEPSDSQGSNCLLGRRTKYVRRKRSAKCDNPVVIESKDVTIVKNCSCTEHDYQCDFCFVRAGDLCTPDTSYCANYDPKKPPDVCHGTYYETRGYRIVPGDTCDPKAGGVDHMPILRTCPNTPPGMTTSSVTSSFPPTITSAFPITSGGVPTTASTTATTTSEPTSPSVKSDSHGATVVGFLIIFAFLGAVLVLAWYLSGKNSTVREYVVKCVPEKFLPDFNEPSASYSALEQDVDNDAPTLEIDQNDSEDKKENKDDDDFNPRGN